VRGLAAWITMVVPARFRGTVTVALVGDATSRRLNRGYRDVDRATDVLSFPSTESWRDGRFVGPDPREHHIGDVVIATGVAARQAKALGHAVNTELRVLALHGFLHLVGFDHERDGGEMAAIESRWRRRGGLVAGLTERAGRR
jgi:probable rRNA maturation factor